MGRKRKTYDDQDDPNSPCDDWSFTLNNYTDEDLAMWERIFEEVRHGLITKEIAPNTGTPHLQGRVVFRRGYRFSQLQKQGWADSWGKTACRQDSLYMIKKDSVIFLDKKPNQGKRSDLDKCVAAAAGGATQKQLFQEFPATMVRYGKGIREAAAALAPDEPLANYTLADFPQWEPITDWSKSIVIMGPPQSGKTEWAAAHFKNPCLVSDLDCLLNFDKDRHDGIIFDDMNFMEIKGQDVRSLQINVTDQTMPRAIRCRYRSPIIPKGTKKIFTCNSWCLDVGDGAILRRIRRAIVIDRETPINWEDPLKVSKTSV